MKTSRKIKAFTGGLLLLSPLFFVGCGDEEDVTAAFTASSTDVATGETVSFSNESVNASYWQWDFGDGGLSFDESPTHEYKTAGNYVVNLVAIGSGGSDSASDTINVEADYDVTIYEGEGIENVDLYDTWAEIQSVYPSTDTLHYVYDDYLEDYGIYYHVIYFYNEGIQFDFLTYGQEVSSTDEVYYIWVLEPFVGATKKGISIGSDIDDVFDVYGDPESTKEGSSYTAYWYDSKGIDFFDYGSGEVDVICIYQAEETSSMSTKSGCLKDIVPKLGRHFVKKK